MKTITRISKRILILVLALVMVVSLLPITAFAANEAPTWDELGSITYTDGATQYLLYENHLYKIAYANIKDSTRLAFTRAGNGESKTLAISCNGLGFLYQENNYLARTEHMPKTPGESLECYPDSATAGYIVENDKPVVIITCMAVGDPTWTWDGTSSATASFTSADGNAVMTTKAAITSSFQPAETCLKKAVVTYTATTSANGATYTDTITADGEPGPHSLEYTVAGNTLTETCANGCGHTAKATLTTPQESYTYTGEFIMPAVLSYDENWKGKKASYTDYKDNVNVGTATVSSDPAGKKITTTFEIKAADIADAEIAFDPEHASYHGIAQKPDVSVVWNGKLLAENTDYTLSWDKSGFSNADAYTATVTGKGNFEGTKDAVFRINPAEIEDAVVTLDQNTFVYNGQPHKPTAVVIFEGEILTEGVDYELYYKSKNSVRQWNGDKPTKFFETGKEYSDSVNAGLYFATVFGKGNFADNGKFACAPYTIEKATVTEPTIASKPYNGSVQTADIADTDLYTVAQNNGGTGVKLSGYYDVVLELKDPSNYKWSSTDNAQVTLRFAITRGTNEWTVYPSIRNWAYGKPANEPAGTARFGEYSVEYSGMANDGTTYSSTAAPTKAGNYTATFTVQETEDYSGLEASVDFTVAKGTYNMTGARWNYTEPFRYDSKEHKVEVVGLPAGVTVESYKNNSAAAPGDYYAEANLAYDANNYNAPAINKLGWTIYNDWTPTEYTVNGSGWMNKDFVITANDGYKISLTNTADGDWKDALTYSIETDDASVTFYLKNETDGTISLAKTLSYAIDKTAPAGKVEFVERSSWEEFLNNITFGLLYKDEVTVQVTVNDSLSGIAKIEYASSDEAKTLDEVKAISDWTEYADRFGVTLEDAKRFVYFIRITDNAGNVTYLSTDGAEYDTSAPVIEGVENGKTYYTTQNVTVTDKNLDSVALNGSPATENITLDGNKEANYIITATDKAGNSTTVTVTMEPIKELIKSTENLSNDNVTLADAPALKELAAKLDELIADPDTTDNEKKAIEDAIKRVGDALEVIGNVNEVEELIGKLPDTLKKDYAAAIKAANDAYNALSDYEKSLVDADVKRALDDANAALRSTDPDSPATGDNSHIMLWIALFFIGGGGAIALTVINRKKKNSR